MAATTTTSQITPSVVARVKKNGYLWKNSASWIGNERIIIIKASSYISKAGKLVGFESLLER